MCNNRERAQREGFDDACARTGRADRTGGGGTGRCSDHRVEPARLRRRHREPGATLERRAGTPAGPCDTVDAARQRPHGRRRLGRGRVHGAAEPHRHLPDAAFPGAGRDPGPGADDVRARLQGDGRPLRRRVSPIRRRDDRHHLRHRRRGHARGRCHRRRSGRDADGGGQPPGRAQPAGGRRRPDRAAGRDVGGQRPGRRRRGQRRDVRLAGGGHRRRARRRRRGRRPAHRAGQLQAARGRLVPRRGRRAALGRRRRGGDGDGAARRAGRCATRTCAGGTTTGPASG